MAGRPRAHPPRPCPFLPSDTAARAETGATFLEAEHSFGETDSDGEREEDSWETVVLGLDGGGSVAFRGRIDRVDRAEDGRLIVYDYKSGASRDYESIDDGGDRLASGKLLQLPIYAMAARKALGGDVSPVSAYYWFASEREGFRRIGYELTTAGEEGLRTTLGVLAGTVEAGMFPPVPGAKQFDGQRRRDTYQNCQYCEFDRICAGGDRKRAWEERKGATELAAYVALAELRADAAGGEAGNDV